MCGWRQTIGLSGLAGALLFSGLAAAQDAPAQPAADAITIPNIAPAPVVLSVDDHLQETAPSQETADPVLPVPPAAPVTFTASEKLRMTVASLLTEDTPLRDLRLTHKERDGLATFYAQADRPLMWVEDGHWTDEAEALAETIRNAGTDGLNPEAYLLPDMSRTGTGRPSWDEQGRAKADLTLSAAAVHYARDARGGRIDPARLSNLIAADIVMPEAAEVLASLTASKNPGITLNAYNPPQLGYLALKAKLARLREDEAQAPLAKAIPNSPPQGGYDAHDPSSAGGLILKIGLHGDNTRPGAPSAKAALSVRDERLATGSVLTSIPSRPSGDAQATRLEGDLIANMERWRWLPRDLGEKHILVNIPEYRLQLIDSGKVVHEAKVVVGKPSSQTPIFSNAIKYLVVNPVWNVPPSILKKEFLPALAADPLYAAKRGYKIVRHGNSIAVQQPPGERNALGFVKFMFPNAYAVYLHDTPSRSLFSADKRAFSHGCVRVEDPFDLAQDIVGDQGWSQGRLRGLIGKGERSVNLRQPLPIHLTYFTLSVDEKGNAKSFDDLYGINRKVRLALGLPS